MVRLDYFKRLWKETEWISKLTEKSRLYFFLDGISAGLIHGSDVSAYAKDGLWKQPSFFRKFEVTQKRNGKAIHHFNNKNHIHLLLNKADFNEHFSIVVNRDWLLVKNVSFECFYEFLKKHNCCFVKPTNGMQGTGVSRILSSDYIGEEKKLYDELVVQNKLIEEAVIAHPDMNFGGKAVNTIRMYTLLDCEGEAHHIKAILRASTGNSHLDNFHGGGIIYEVDLVTGVVCSKGRSITSLEEDIIVQPNTDIVMIGRKIPNWDIVLQKSAQAAKLIPECRYIGWDIAITQDGVEFIEGNHDADHVLLNTPGSRCHWKEFLRYW